MFITRSLLTFLLPTTCLFCRCVTRDRADVCAPCQNDLPILPQSCAQCGQFLTSGTRCGKCLHKAPPFTRTHALFPYQPPLTGLVSQLKFQGDLAIARWFGQSLAHLARQLWEREPRPDLILPVPLHTKRLRERGFNQALEIAKPFAKALQVPLDARGTIRHKYTPPQHQLNANERQKNLHNAFTALRRYDHLHIALLDDVVTTTQTITDLSHTLLEAGASRVDVFCITRA